MLLFPINRLSPELAVRPSTVQSWKWSSTVFQRVIRVDRQRFEAEIRRIAESRSVRSRQPSCYKSRQVALCFEGVTSKATAQVISELSVIVISRSIRVIVPGKWTPRGNSKWGGEDAVLELLFKRQRWAPGANGNGNVVKSVMRAASGAQRPRRPPCLRHPLIGAARAAVVPNPTVRCRSNFFSTSASRRRHHPLWTLVLVPGGAARRRNPPRGCAPASLVLSFLFRNAMRVVYTSGAASPSATTRLRLGVD